MCTEVLYVSLWLMIFSCPFLHCKALRTAMYKRYINSIIIIIPIKKVICKLWIISFPILLPKINLGKQINKKDSERNSSNFELDKFWTRERRILFWTNEAIKKSVGMLLSRQTSLLTDLNKMQRSDRVCSELFTFHDFPWLSPVFHNLLSFKTKSRLWYTVYIFFT